MTEEQLLAERELRVRLLQLAENKLLEIDKARRIRFAFVLLVDAIRNSRPDELDALMRDSGVSRWCKTVVRVIRGSLQKRSVRKLEYNSRT